jgi:glycosidase
MGGTGQPGSPVRRQQATAIAAVAAALLIVVGSVGFLEATQPATTPAPSEPPPVTSDDRPPLAVDGEISDDDLFHDSRDDRYRVPYGAVPAGTEVTLRLRAAAGDLSEATIRVWDSFEELQALVPMEVVATDPTQGEHGYDYWEATLRTSAVPTVLYYRFIVRDGPTTRYIEDDLAADGGAVPEGNDGGPGLVLANSPDSSWQIDVYEPDFATPAWTRGAVVYQVFPDRFFNGDPENDPSPDAEQGSDGAALYRYGDVYGNDVLPKAWDERPEGYCRAYQGASCDEEPLGRDFFGGDLAGITAKLDDLEALGVTVLYLNPIFAAPSNHRYDTSSYDVIDPDLGTQADFDRLVDEAGARGIRVLLDGVFNHVSSDSPWFDRFGRFAETGACEAADSPYRAWFTFRPPAGNEPAPCEPSTAGGDDTYYQGWFGFDTIPEVIEGTEVFDLFTGPDGVARRWIEAGTAGWRLDVMDNLSHGFMRRIREAVKETDPDALVLGEQWHDTSAWLLGDEADSTMNYRFRRAVIGLINGDTPDLDGAIVGLSPSQFASRMEGLMEDYPKPAFDALLNLVDSHDTTRILWTLTPGRDDPALKESESNLATGKAKLRQLAALQLTWPGMASIYYGTEAGLTGHDDPDDRRPYPWDAIDEDLLAWYRTLGTLRAEHVALRDGDLRFVETDDQVGTLAFLRRTDVEAGLTVLNLSPQRQTVEIDVSGLLPDGAELADGLGGPGTAVVDGKVRIGIDGQAAAVLLTAPGTDLAPPAAPTGLTAAASAAEVALTWEAPAGEAATGYEIWRSLVRGGGYELVGTAEEPAFVDDTARNGTRYHYVVVALDAAGNPGARSEEVTALPMLAIADARLEEPAELSQPLSAVDPGTPIAARVTVDGVTEAPGPTVGILAQLGFGTGGEDLPESDYRWSTMTFDSDVDGSDRLVGTVRPDALGSWNVVLRVSIDGGVTWIYADRGGIVPEPWSYRQESAVTLDAIAAADQQPPPTPAAPEVTVITDASLTLAWDPVTAPDLYRYEVYRGTTAGGPYERIGSATEARFTDDGVAAGSEYVYVIVAVDTSFNRSTNSAEVAASAQAREVAVTFTVTIPATTPADDTVYIAGDFQGWDPGGTPMTRLDDGTWTITLPFTEGDPPQYKYTRGTWEAVEKDAACGELANRTITVTFGDGGSAEVADTVEKWRDVDQCG